MTFTILVTVILAGTGITMHTLDYTVNSVAAETSSSDNNHKATNVTSISFHNSSSLSANNTSQPTLIGNVTVASLKRSNISVNPHQRATIPAPVSPNLVEGRYVNETPALTENPPDKKLVPLNVTNSSSTLVNTTDSSPSNSNKIIYHSSLPAGELVTTTPNASSVANDTIIKQEIRGIDSLTSGGPPPPDVQVAAGPRHVVELVNLQGEVWLKKGLSAKEFSLAQFFNSGSDDISDPRIIYDNASKTWFASILDRTTDSVKLAVSMTDDPLGTWSVYDFPFAACPDEPMIATSSDKFVISANDVQKRCLGRTLGAQYIIVDKQDLITGFSKPRFLQSDANITQFSLLPVKMSDSSESSKIYLATVGNQGSRSAKLYVIDGKVPFLSARLVTLPVRTINNTENIKAEQATPEYRINVGDARLVDGAIFQDKIWLAFNDACIPDNDTEARSCIGLIQIDANKNNVTQNFDFFLPHMYFYYPALGIDSGGNLKIVFGMSSKWMYPSLFVSGQKADSTNANLDKAANVTIGGGLIVGGRYGDYFGLTIDPINPNTFWVAGEYNNVQMRLPGPDEWATVVANITTVLSESSEPTP
jgi:hypothetical protein